jgi:adenylosuccinate synthase
MNTDQNDIVIGMLLGDEGKGTIVDYLASQRETHAVVRFSGGAQAAHNVITPDGRHHTFSQFGSASFHGVPTILSKHMMVEPYSLAREGSALSEKVNGDVFAGLLISDNSLITTPIHKAINRVREIRRGANRHGSTGRGIGETRHYHLLKGDVAPRMTDIHDLNTLNSKLILLLSYAREELGEDKLFDEINIPQILKDYALMLEDGLLDGIVTDDRISEELNNGYIIFEGSQGVLLDENLGFHPNTTWSGTTQRNAQSLLEDAGLPSGNVVGVVRKYLTRHGAGPFPGEIMEEVTEELPEEHNKMGVFQGGWRRGYFALPLWDYAVRANGGVDEVAVTHMDLKWDTYVKDFEGFPELPTDFFNADRDKQVETIELMMQASQHPVYEEGVKKLIYDIRDIANAPVSIYSYGKTWEHKRTSMEG